MDGPCAPVIADECEPIGGQDKGCRVQALRWFEDGEFVEQLWISLQPRGTGFTVRGGDQQYVNDPDLALVRMTVDWASRDGFPQLPSWPPTE
jgi:hypothetical protein